MAWNLSERLTSLRARLFLLVFIALLPVVGLLVYDYLDQRERAADDAREGALQLTHLVAAEGDLAAQQSRQLLIGLSRLEEVRGDPAACNALFADLLAQFPLYANLGVVERDGNVNCSGLPLTEPVSAADRVWFQRVLATRDFAIGEYQIGRLTHVPSLNVAYPVLTPEGDVTRVVFAAIDLRWLQQFAIGAAFPDGATVLVADRNGTILARVPADGETWVGRNAADTPLVSAVLARGTGTIETHGLDGSERLYAFAPLTRDSDVGAFLVVGLSPAAAYAASDGALLRNLILVACVALVALIAAGIGAELFVFRQTGAVLDAVHRVGTGDLSARSAVRGHGEIALLGRAFDDMADDLQRREEEAVVARSGLEAVTDHLRRANAELEAFTHSVSHDLKEPLRTIEAFSQFLLADYNDALDDQGRDYLQRVGGASARMKRLIEELLALSRLARLPDPSEPVDAGRALATIIEGMRYTIETHQARVEVQEDLPSVLADAPRLEQIFGNLISNALKFNRDGQPVVRIGCRQDGGEAIFHVADDGIGIDPEYHEKVFGIFQRLNRREDFDGTGAGLAIARRAVEGLGGRIWVESALGEGATFLFTLPTAAAPESLAEKAA
ncbi:MAG: ATP-binding protein [Dehalococcoidia bacterium]